MNDKKIQGKEKADLQLKNKKKQKLKEKGITLIALVVTIIILLILVGVTISQISGENGLIRKAKEAVEKYKNASEEEQIQLGKINQYVSDFEIIGGNEGEDKASVSIKENGLEVTGNVENKTITVKVTVIGEASGVEYKISSEDNWTQKDTDGKVIEGDQKQTEYTHTFNGLKLGESYYIRVKVYDTNNKYVEALSNVIALNYIMTAEDKDVLETKTYIGKNGTKSTGTMESRGKVEKALNAEESYTIEPGYYSGGKITANSLRDQTDGDAVAGDILQGKTAYVDGSKVIGNMKDYSEQTVEAKEVSNDGDFALLTIPENGYYNAESKIKTESKNITTVNDAIRGLIESSVSVSTGSIVNSGNGFKTYTFSQDMKCLMIFQGYNGSQNGLGRIESCSAKKYKYLDCFTCSSHVQTAVILIDGKRGDTITYSTWGDSVTLRIYTFN